MKLLLLLSALQAHAAGDQPFSKACDYYQCVPELKAVEDGFQLHGRFDDFRAPAVYSGECRHLSPDYRQEDVHHGMIFLDRAEHGREVMFSSQFGWFYGSNPWKDWDVKKARAESKSPTLLVSMGSYSLANPARHYPDVSWLYWLTHDLSKDEVYVIGAWGADRRVYCRLQRNR